MKFVLLINIKLLNIVISFLLNIAEHENWFANKYENANFYWHFHIHKQRKFHAQLSWAWKKFYDLGARSAVKGNNSHPFCKGYVLKEFAPDPSGENSFRTIPFQSKLLPFRIDHFEMGCNNNTRRVASPVCVSLPLKVNSPLPVTLTWKWFLSLYKERNSQRK